MFSNILSKIKTGIDDKKTGHKDLVAKISRMNLTEMRAYINNRALNFPVNEDGLNEVLYRLLKEDESTSKRYIEIDDMDSKIKKGFDLVLGILVNKKISVATIELANTFLEVYIDIIEKFDKENKQIYAQKFKHAISLALESIKVKMELKRKLDFIDNNVST